MENERDLGLASRKEETREVRQVTIPLQFTLAEIKQHFEESINAVKKQYDVAQSLSDAGDLDGCKNIWRSQVVFCGRNNGLLYPRNEQVLFVPYV